VPQDHIHKQAKGQSVKLGMLSLNDCKKGLPSAAILFQPYPSLIKTEVRSGRMEKQNMSVVVDLENIDLAADIADWIKSQSQG
jgi:hypothetical protein